MFTVFKRIPKTIKISVFWSSRKPSFRKLYKREYSLEYTFIGVGMQKKKIFDVFFREKPALMLIGLKNYGSEVYASVLAKQIDCTYSHVVKILQEMEKADLVAFKKQG